MTKAKEALDDLDNEVAIKEFADKRYVGVISEHDGDVFVEKHYYTIRRALRILDKIESGEKKKEKPPFPENYQFAEQGINCRSHDPYGYGESGYNQCLDDLRGIE